MKLTPKFIFILALACCIFSAQAATFDNFNDGIDDGWLRYNPTSGKYSFPVESGSVAYKLESSWGSLFNPGRIASINIKEPAHSQFHVEVDLLNWTYNWGEDIGLVARLQARFTQINDSEKRRRYFFSHFSGEKSCHVTRSRPCG